METDKQNRPQPSVVRAHLMQNNNKKIKAKVSKSCHVRHSAYSVLSGNVLPGLLKAVAV